jgi:DNA-binding beta-propeller fold protein YncE
MKTASCLALGLLLACGGGQLDGDRDAALTARAGRFPLLPVAELDLPGRANRFDYQDVDRAHGRLVLTHMNDASVVVTKLDGTSVVKVLPNIPTPRGVVVAPEVDRIFVTSSPRQLVVIDASSLEDVARVATGNGPDGVGWDPAHRVVAVSDQQDGAISLISDAAMGARVAVHVGGETGNVIFDPGRGVFWTATVTSGEPDRLVAIDPVTHRVTTRIDLRGCQGAHGVRLHPDGASAFVACEENDVLVRVDLANDAHAIASAPTGGGPDVLAADPGFGLLYVAAESGDLVVFDLQRPGLVRVDAENVGRRAHSVAVDPDTHRVFFPLEAGPRSTPVLRILKPNGSS